MADSSRLGCFQDGLPCSESCLFQHWVQWYINKFPKSLKDPLLPVSAWWSTVNIRLVADQTDYFWEGFWQKQAAVIPGYPMASAFETSGEMMGMFPLLQAISLSLSRITSPYLAKPAPSRPLEPRFWVHQMLGGYFRGSPMKEKHQSFSQQSVWIGWTLQPVSDNPLVFLCCHLLSKMQDGRKERKKIPK